MIILVSARTCSLLMPVTKLPPLLKADSAQRCVQFELEKKYGTRMTLYDACKELGIKPDTVIKRIGRLKYQHYQLCRQLEDARVFKGKNTFFWTDRIALILSEGNKNDIQKFK